ncbi:MAG: VWA domain-containing protein [Phycisphaerae bacterium]|nr:MAG: VWA domain-containing protein [Phycisphaerae bacterium]
MYRPRAIPPAPMPVPSGVDFRLDDPVWGWLLLAGIGVTLVGSRLLRSMSPFRRWVAVATRVVLLTVLVASLAGLSTSRTLNTLAVVAVIDTSGSVRRYYRAPDGRPGLELVRDFLDTVSENRGPDDLLGVITFDGKAVTLARPRRGTLPRIDFESPVAPGTNIAKALELARTIVPPEALARIVLLSDGVSTAGNPLGPAAATHGPWPIDTVHLAYDHPEETVFERLDGPSTAPAGATITLRAVLSATVPSRGTLRLLREGEPIDLNPSSPQTARIVDLLPGLNVIRLDVPLPPGRVHRFHAVYEPDIIAGPDGQPRPQGDAIAENNTASAFTVTPGSGRVLLVDGYRRDTADSTLAAVLRDAGAEVEIIQPEALPTDLLALQAFDLVLLDNVPASGETRAHKALASYVADLGGGLVMLGGPESFAPGGWRETPLEPILPVLLEVPDLLVTAQAATVFVLDNSGSMSWPVLGSDASQQEIANEAAILAIRALDPSDLIGVITFNSRAEIVVPLAQNREAPDTIAKVRGISSGGGTNLLPGLELARRELARAATDAKVKHVIVLTDGISRRKDQLPDLVRQLAADGVKVSTVAVGDGADHHALRALAEIGGGGYFHAANATQLPRLLLKAVRVVRTPYLREEPITPVVLATGSPLTAGIVTPPTLHGMVLTRPRTEPTVTLAIAAPTGEPILAAWPVGLGQAAAWTSDDEIWAREWIDAPEYRRLWTQILRAISRAPDPVGFVAQVEPRDGALAVRLAATDADARPLDGLAVDASIYAPSGTSTSIILAQTGPGVYEGLAPNSETGSVVAVIKPRLAGRAMPAVIAGTSIPEGIEYRARTSDGDRLARLSASTGGRVLNIESPRTADLWSRQGLPPRRAVTTFGHQLILASLVLLVLDLATRRIAWDRWFSRRFQPGTDPDDARTRAAAAARTTGELRAGRSTDAAEIPAIALGEREAQSLAQAARDRRAAERLAHLRTDANVPIIVRREPSADPEPRPQGLHAAKKRALERFEDDPESHG